MKTQPLMRYSPDVDFLKPKRLQPLKKENGFATRNRYLAEAAHEYMCERRPNHLRARAKLHARIVELNAALGVGESVPSPTQQVFLKAIKAERRRWETMWQRIVSLTPAMVDDIILDLEERMPGRVVKLRPGSQCRWPVTPLTPWAG